MTSNDTLRSLEARAERAEEALRQIADLDPASVSFTEREGAAGVMRKIARGALAIALLTSSGVQGIAVPIRTPSTPEAPARARGEGTE